MYPVPSIGASLCSHHSPPRRGSSRRLTLMRAVATVTRDFHAIGRGSPRQVASRGLSVASPAGLSVSALGLNRKKETVISSGFGEATTGIEPVYTALQAAA